MIWTALGAQIRELDEAICAGKDVGYALDQMIGQLDSAAGWGTWDILGGGMLATMAQAWTYERCAKRGFPSPTGHKPLPHRAGRRVPAPGARPSGGEFTSFADYFFDGLFVDLYIQDKIGTARRSAEETAAQVEDLLSQLRRERDRTAERAAELERERERLLAGM